MMQSCLWQMARTRAAEEAMLDIPEGSGGNGRGRGRGQAPCGDAPPPPPPPPPVSIEQLLATQNKLMRRLVDNDERRLGGRQQHPRQQDMNTSYLDFLVTHPPLFSGAKDPLEADDWLRTTESKFSLLHCTEY
jgi:hypothetical protein